MRRFASLSLLCSLALFLGAPILSAAPKEESPPKPANFKTEVRKDVTAILDKLEQDSDFFGARYALERRFDQVIQYGQSSDAPLFLEVNSALRMVRSLEALKKKDRIDTLKYLRKNKELAATLAYLIDPQYDKIQHVFDLLKELRAKRGKLVAQHPTVAAAICVVHDEPMVRDINENRVSTDDPLKIFDFYVSNQKKLVYDIKTVPANLMVYMVDATVPKKDQQWALSRYAKKPKIGRRFFEITWIGERYEKGGEDNFKKHGYSLQNIKKYGGVCADQAYFAMEVGKAVGVPTTYVTGKSATVGHAWVGYLESTGGGRAKWNFNAGRYAAYQGVKGSLLHPQTRQYVPDSILALEAATISIRRTDQRIAAALTDAAIRLMELEGQNRKLQAPVPNNKRTENRLPKPIRGANIEAQLALLQQALRKNAGHQKAWLTVRNLAVRGKMDMKQKHRWVKMLMETCGSRYPDFSLTVLIGFVNSLETVEQKNKVLEGAFSKFKKRKDLAAEIRMMQADLWSKADNLGKAFKYSYDVVQRFANAGPFVIKALNRCEAFLVMTGAKRKILPLYEETWSRIRRPPDQGAAVFNKQSNWYQVGVMLASRLHAAGNKAKAEKILKAISYAKE